MKKTTTILLLSFFLLAGCQSSEKNVLLEIKEDESPLTINEITDESLVENLQELLEAFYFNPLVTEDTTYEFFTDQSEMLAFAAYYKNHFASPESLDEIQERFFGYKSSQELAGDIGDYQGYLTSQEKNLLPLIEAVYENNDYLIAKAVVYSINEGTSSEKKSAATITMTFEREASEGEYKIIDYKYERIIDSNE